MRNQNWISFLVIIMIAIVFIVTGSTILILYNTAFNQEKIRLVETAQSQARLIEAVARFDIAHHKLHPETHPEDPSVNTINQIINAHKNYSGFGKTGEFTLSKKVENNIVFILSHRHFDLDQPISVPMDSNLAEPMRLALSGNSGTIVGLDYRGETVLAAFEPVDVLNLGIVAKIDLSEIRSPFIKAGLTAVFISVFVIILSTLLFLFVTTPILKKLEKDARIQAQLNKSLSKEIKVREKVEAEVRQSKILLESSIESPEDMIILSLNRQYQYMYFNKIHAESMKHVFGAQLQIGDCIFDHMKGKDDIEKVKDHYDRALGGEGHVATEAYGDGQVRYHYEIRYNPIFNHNNEIVGVSSFAQDISDRIRADEELKKSEARFKKMIEKSPLPMVISDQNQDISFFNDKFTELFGYTLEDVSIAEEWWETAYPDEDYRAKVQHSWMVAIEKANADKTDIEMQEWELTTKDRTKRRCEFYMVPLDEFSLIIMKDITERKQTENKLREEEKRYRSLYNETPAMLHSIDSEGKIISISKYWLKIMGYEQHEVIGRKSTDFQTTESRERVDMSLFFKNGYCENLPLEFIKKNGDIIDILLSEIIETDEQGKMIRSLAILNDVTEKKQAETQIKKALKEKETLLHEIHHRVKNNLAVISSLLNLQVLTMKDEKLKEALTDSRNRIKTMATIHETLYQSDNLAAIDMNTYLLKLASNIFQSYINSDRINMTVEAENIVIETKQASSIGLIINEFISNSLKHAFPDNQAGEINICLEKLAKDKIKLIYVDNGIGLPEKINWKESDSLGLQLVNTLVKGQLDGAIELKTDNGTCFVIEFELL